MFSSLNASVANKACTNSSTLKMKVLVAQQHLHCRQILYLLSHQESPKNTGVNSYSLLQDIFPTQGMNLCLLHCRQILYSLSLQTLKYYLYPKYHRMQTFECQKQFRRKLDKINSIRHTYVLVIFMYYEIFSKIEITDYLLRTYTKYYNNLYFHQQYVNIPFSHILCYIDHLIMFKILVAINCC